MRTLAVLFLGAFVACTAEANEPFALPGDLPERADPPALLEDSDGSVSAADWPVHREELLGLFSNYVYGFAPPAEPIMSTRVAMADDVEGARYEEFEIRSGPATLYLAIFRPAGDTPAPVILALNKCGNQSLTLDTRLRRTSSSNNSGCDETIDATVGSRAESWPIRDIVARGFALATFHESDMHVDSPGEAGVDALIEVDAPLEAQWGVVAQWAWGLRRAVDHLVADDAIDPSRIAVTGHSRRGKAALWAGAQDERIAVVIPHQSGTVGATMFRGAQGESLFSITLLFPHWFPANLAAFADKEARLPIDQHQLLALVAPRSVLVTNGAADTRADPPSALRAVRLAAPAWDLLGSPVALPAEGAPPFESAISWFERDGDHALEARDWQTFLDYASQRFAR